MMKHKWEMKRISNKREEWNNSCIYNIVRYETFTLKWPLLKKGSGMSTLCTNRKGCGKGNSCSMRYGKTGNENTMKS